MKTNTKNPKGIVTIVSTLIVASIAIVFAVNMLEDGLVNSSLSNNAIQYEQARINALACLEDTLIRMKKQDQFDRDLNYNFSPVDTCTTNITLFTENQISTGITEQLADLEIVGVSQNFERTFLYELRMTQFDVNDTDGSLNYIKDIDFISIEEI